MHSAAIAMAFSPSRWPTPVLLWQTQMQAIGASASASPREQRRGDRLNPPSFRHALLSHSQRARAAACMSASTLTGTELKERLLPVLEAAPARGLDSSLEGSVGAEEVLDLVADLEAVDPSYDDGWMYSPHLEGAWRLLYSSSPTMRRNGGLVGFPLMKSGVQTPELFMSIQTGRVQAVTFEEPVLTEGVEGEPVLVEATWKAMPNDVMQISPRRIVRGDASWEPANSQLRGEVDFDQDKAVRVMSACRPIYLDEDLLILRGQVESVIFVFERRKSYENRLANQGGPSSRIKRLLPTVTRPNIKYVSYFAISMNVIENEIDACNWYNDDLRYPMFGVDDSHGALFAVTASRLITFVNVCASANERGAVVFNVLVRSHYTRSFAASTKARSTTGLAKPGCGLALVSRQRCRCIQSVGPSELAGTNTKCFSALRIRWLADGKG
eukprot:6196461-Pleurochrysis_carterae.AAC.4